MVRDLAAEVTVPDLADRNGTDRFVVISGCSGGGKSTLLDALAAEGFAVVEEPGRRIVAQEALGSGSALPWVDLAAFARRAIAMALEDWARMAATRGWVFFDRGLVDAAAALQHATGEPVVDALGPAHRYHRRVFLTPPWSEIYRQDIARRHDQAAAIAEYDRLRATYARLGYQPVILPRISVKQRASYVLNRLSSG
ncbi:MAG: AAA family ATPase [Geminicoccaceae bacterium]